MEKQTLLVGFVFIFLLQSPLALAINCNSISPSNYESCMEILNSKIPENEKELLISNLEYKNQFFPDHDYIFDQNSKLEFDIEPEGTKIYNKEFIKEAWMNIFAFMPSILYNDTLYVPNKTTIQTGFNYELEIPENYYSPRYPKTKNRDCKTKYYLEEKEAENKVYVNGQYQEEGDLFDININKDSEIKSIFNIDVEVRIKHYRWKKYCSSRRDDGSCRRYKRKCKYRDSEIKKENLQIIDIQKVKLYENNLVANIKPIDSYDGITKLKLNKSDSVRIDFANALYEFDKYSYSINYSKPPYYVNVLRAEDYNQEKVFNLFNEAGTLIIKNPDNCKIKAFDFFNILEKDCNSASQNIKFFIKTDKLKYDKGEKIKVDIFPKDVFVKISYGDKVKTARGSVKFTADNYENRITAEYNGLRAEKIIYITNRERLWVIWNLVVFTFLNYFLYVVLKKYYKKVK